MPQIILSETPTTATTADAAAVNQLVAFTQTTATGFINPVFSSVVRTSNNIAISYNYNIANLDSPVTGSRSSTPGILTGRRPRFGQLFPRGYFNR
jgi:hypothetical protein